MASLDILAAIALTASAAILVGTIVAIYPGTLAARLRIAGVFAVWFVLVALSSALGLLDPVKGLGVPALGVAIVAPIAVIVFAVASSRQRLAHVMAMPMPALIATHVLRVLGLLFLLLWSLGRLTAPFAPSAGWGDIVTGIAAGPVAWAVWRKTAGWRALAIAWNLFGAADLIAALALGILSAPGSPLPLFPGQSEPVMTSLPWVLIPAYLVPVWLMTHVLMLIELARQVPGASAADQRLLA